MHVLHDKKQTQWRQHSPPNDFVSNFARSGRIEVGLLPSTLNKQNYLDESKKIAQLYFPK